MNYIIRKAEKEDLENGLLEVYIEGYKYHQKGRPDVFKNQSDDIFKEDLTNMINNVPIIVILDKDRVLGYLSYIIKGNKNKGYKKLVVDQLVISEKSRGKGLGKRLMETVKDIAINEECERIELNCWLFNTNAIDMYKHIGFKEQRIMFEMEL